MSERMLCCPVLTGRSISPPPYGEQLLHQGQAGQLVEQKFPLWTSGQLFHDKHVPNVVLQQLAVPVQLVLSHKGWECLRCLDRRTSNVPVQHHPALGAVGPDLA